MENTNKKENSEVEELYYSLWDSQEKEIDSRNESEFKSKINSRSEILDNYSEDIEDIEWEDSHQKTRTVNSLTSEFPNGRNTVSSIKKAIKKTYEDMGY